MWFLQILPAEGVSSTFIRTHSGRSPITSTSGSAAVIGIRRYGSRRCTKRSSLAPAQHQGDRARRRLPCERGGRHQCGAHSVRQMSFDKERCADGKYCRYDVDPDTGQFSKNLLHDDNACNASDAPRYVAVATRGLRQARCYRRLLSHRWAVAAGLSGRARLWRQE